MSSTSVLEMDVIPTMGGSKSQYLPEVYINYKLVYSYNIALHFVCVSVVKRIMIIEKSKLMIS